MGCHRIESEQRSDFDPGLTMVDTSVRECCALVPLSGICSSVCLTSSIKASMLRVLYLETLSHTTLS